MVSTFLNNDLGNINTNLSDLKIFKYTATLTFNDKIQMQIGTLNNITQNKVNMNNLKGMITFCTGGVVSLPYFAKDSNMIYIHLLLNNYTVTTTCNLIILYS